METSRTAVNLAVFRVEYTCCFPNAAENVSFHLNQCTLRFLAVRAPVVGEGTIAENGDLSNQVELAFQSRAGQ